MQDIVLMRRSLAGQTLLHWCRVVLFIFGNSILQLVAKTNPSEKDQTGLKCNLKDIWILLVSKFLVDEIQTGIDTW